MERFPGPPCRPTGQDHGPVSGCTAGHDCRSPGPVVASGRRGSPSPCPRTEPASRIRRAATGVGMTRPRSRMVTTAAPAPPFGADLPAAARIDRPVEQAAPDRARRRRAPRRHDALPERQGRAARRRPRHPGGRLRLPRRPVGRRQVDAHQAAHPRRGGDPGRGGPRRPGPRPAAAPPGPEVRRKIGIVFQDFKLLPTKTVWENVAFALEVTGTPAARIRPAVDRVLALVGLTAQAGQPPTSCPAASSSGRRSPGRSSTTRGSSSPTSRPATSTRSSAGRSSSCCCASTSWASPC